MWKHSGSLKAFTENIRDRLQFEFENEKWKVLLKQNQLLEEYGQIIDRLRHLDLQISKLTGSPPPSETCPECHYRRDAAVRLVPVGGRRPGQRRHHDLPRLWSGRSSKLAQRSFPVLRPQRDSGKQDVSNGPSGEDGPGRDQNAMRQSLGQRLSARGFNSTSGLRVLPGLRRRPELLQDARHTHHKGRRIGLSVERGSPARSRFLRQSPVDARSGEICYS